MPRTRPPTSGYARIAQAEEEEYLDDSEDENSDPLQSALSNADGIYSYSPIQPGRQSQVKQPRAEASGVSTPRRRPRNHDRPRSNSGIDIKAINARLEKWADEIAQRFKIRKIKGKTQEEERLEIHHSVFQAPDNIRPATAETLSAIYAHEKMSKAEFEAILESVRVAIELGVHPKMISQGSSGSYFARNSEGKTVGVFKPKDEEPYASRNPKWTKWIHRNLFPFFFGRACLIPNLSYVSEAAAYVLDRRLQTNIVPYTDVIQFSSIAFYHDFWDRRAYWRKNKPLPQKVGSFQAFLPGYQDATIFLKQHPWPDSSGFHTEAAPKRGRRRWANECRPGNGNTSSDDEDERSHSRGDSTETSRSRSFWSEKLQESFREELEKLVILDYIMRNTDRGLDNWMIKVDESTQQASLVAKPPASELTNGDKENSPVPEPDEQNNPYKSEDPMTTGSGSSSPSTSSNLKISLGAIDNSLSWPWKHPDAWRSYPFGWLFLPVSLIGQPFSEKTRLHFLPLLTSKQWWSETQIALRRCFEQDSDFQERMYARQIAVMKGQAWNVVETLKTSDHGPLELTRRARVCVWDDLVEIPTVVPMSAPSPVFRRQEADKRNSIEEEGMDISTAGASTQALPILHVTQPSTELPHPNRFDLPRSSISEEDRTADGDIARSALLQHRQPGSLDLRRMTRDRRPFALDRSKLRRTRTRVSFDEPRTLHNHDLAAQRTWHSSLNVRRVNSSPFYEYGDELEGDLGYAAAEDMERNRRKVIVERLENVTGKNPYFTWC